MNGSKGSEPDPFAAHVTVYSCVTKIAQSLAAIPWSVRSGTDEDPSDVLDGPWYDLFNRPNPYMSRNELKELTATYMLLSGECFWVLDDGSGGIIGESDVPRFIWPVSGSAAKEITTGSGQLTGWRIAGVYGSTPRDYPLHAVVQLADMRNPACPWRGVSRLQAAMASVSSDYQALLFNRSWYENGASPSLYMESGENQITAEQANEVRKMLDDGWRGASKAGKTFVAPYGLKVKDSPIKFAEMQFLEGLKWNRARVAESFNVPLALLGDATDVDFNTMRHQKRMFYENNILPLAQKIEDLIEVQLIEPRMSAKDVASARRGKGKAVWVEFLTTNMEVLQDDRATKINDAKGLQTLGYPLNEINERLELGMENQEGWGDVGLLPTTLAPAEEVAIPPEPEPVPAALAPFQGPNPPPPGPDVTPPTDPKAEDTENPDKGKEESPNRSRAPEESRARRDRQWAEHCRALVPHEGAFRSRVQRYLYARRKEVLDFLGGKRSVRATDEEIQRFLREVHARWDKQLVDELADPYRTAATAGVQQIAKATGGLKVFSAADPSLTDFLAKKAIRVVTINETLIESLRESLLQGTANGETTQELQERVRLGFGTSRANALRIARTEAAQTVNGARDLAMRGEGIEKQEWISSRDPIVRDSHAIDGEVQALGSSFSNGLKYPGDVDGPPGETINCRCTSAPVLE